MKHIDKSLGCNKQKVLDNGELICMMYDLAFGPNSYMKGYDNEDVARMLYDMVGESYPEYDEQTALTQLELWEEL